MSRTSLGRHQEVHDHTKPLNNVFCGRGKRLATVLWVTEFFNVRNGECLKKRKSLFCLFVVIDLFTELWCFETWCRVRPYWGRQSYNSEMNRDLMREPLRHGLEVCSSAPSNTTRCLNRFENSYTVTAKINCHHQATHEGNKGELNNCSLWVSDIRLRNFSW